MVDEQTGFLMSYATPSVSSSYECDACCVYLYPVIYWDVHECRQLETTENYADM